MKHESPHRCRALWLATALFLLATPARATLIAHWDFDGGTAADVSGSATDYDLGAVGGGPDLSLGFARFDGSEASPSFLETSGPGGMPNWTISLWVRSQGALDQGAFQGLFSNNTSPSANYSWQVESAGGVYQFRTWQNLYTIGAPSGLGVWDHIVVRKFGGNDGDLWLNGVQVGASFGTNPGGLQNFRLGTNRNTNNFWQGDLDDVRVFDSVEDPSALFAAPPASVPAPSLAVLLASLLAPSALRRPAPTPKERPQLEASKG